MRAKFIRAHKSGRVRARRQRAVDEITENIRIRDIVAKNRKITECVRLLAQPCEREYHCHCQSFSVDARATKLNEVPKRVRRIVAVLLLLLRHADRWEYIQCIQENVQRNN